MKWALGGAVVALATMAIFPACGSFGADDKADGGALDGGGGDGAAACLPDPCADAGPSCTLHDFASGCGDSFTFSGNVGDKGVVGECTGGKAHVAARNTLDSMAELALKTPGQYDAIRVSARIAVTEWDGGRVLTVMLDGVKVGVLQAVQGASGTPRFTLCSQGACEQEAFNASGAEEHLFVLDITSASVALSVDCVPVATHPAKTVLNPGAPLLVDFGHPDAMPIDGTLDDLAVSYR